MTVEIEMSDEEFKTISNYAAENKIGVAEFFLNLAREKIEDAEWDYVGGNFNAETIAAMQEAKLISEGKIPAKSYGSVEELMEDLMSDDDD